MTDKALGLRLLGDDDLVEERLVRQPAGRVVRLQVHGARVGRQQQVSVEVGAQRAVVLAARFDFLRHHGETRFEGSLFAGQHLQAHRALEVRVDQTVPLVLDPPPLGYQFVELAGSGRHHLVEVRVRLLPEPRPDRSRDAGAASN
ncbi:MAG: hypothetical protein LBJ62_10625 [Bifidobacteriaceae bacterium]|nr:hypothetical protein [Bifidobacteriaceae bacterium]